MTQQWNVPANLITSMMVRPFARFARTDARIVLRVQLIAMFALEITEW
jgi:hypothetical protein